MAATAANTRQRLRLWTWGRVAIGHPEHPLHRFDIHLLHVRPIVYVLLMTQRTAEDASLTIVPDPGECEIAVFPLDIGLSHIDRGCIEAHQHAYAVTREISVFIEFVGELEFRTKMRSSWKFLVLHVEECLLVPWMIDEDPADHLDPLRPMLITISDRMAADQPFAVVVHEREERGLLLRIEIKISGAIEINGIEILKIPRVDG